MVFVVFSHGDFGYGNILYDSRTASLSGVIDWDTSRDVELPGVDFINLLIQKFRAKSRMDESYNTALRWLESDEPLPSKIRAQLHERFGITGERLQLYSIIAVMHLMGRDFQFHQPGSLRQEEREHLFRYHLRSKKPECLTDLIDTGFYVQSESAAASHCFTSGISVKE